MHGLTPKNPLLFSEEAYPMKYTDFRPKTVIFTAALIFFSLAFMSAIDLLNSLIMWSVTDTGKFIEFNVVKIGAVGTPAIAIFSFWLYRFLTPLHTAFSALAAGKKISAELRQIAMRHIRMTRRYLILANFCVYGVTIIVTIIQSGFAALTSPLSLLATLCVNIDVA
jgi:hypothetical protein